MSNTWIEVLKIAPGILAIVWQATVWLRRRSDAQWAADIGRDVEEKLKSHESRLRVRADLQLRMHDRSVQLLRELAGAALEARHALVQLGTVISRPTHEKEEFRAAFDRASGALVKLQMLTVTSPPEHGVTNAANPFREALAAIGEMRKLREAPPDERQAAMGAMVDALDTGLDAVRSLCAVWNEKLWLAAQHDPTDLALVPATAVVKAPLEKH